MPDNAPPGVWTEDESPGYGCINGRRWRCTDPAIPETLKQEMVNALMDARRSISRIKRTGENVEMAHARGHVHVAKVALGERGPEWWLPMDEASLRVRIRATVLVLLAARGEASSLRPSEVARATRGDHWRALLPLVRDEAWKQVAEKHLRILQNGLELSSPVRGPIRLAQGTCFRRFLGQVIHPAGSGSPTL